MDEENEQKTGNITTVKYKEIGNTTFKIVSNYSGTNTYSDVIKSVLRREVEKE